MYGRATFERNVLAILLLESAVALGYDWHDHELSNDPPPVSVSSFCEELWIRKSSSIRTGFSKNVDFLLDSLLFCSVWLVLAPRLLYEFPQR